MTKITHVITLEGDDEEVWPFNKDLRQHIASLKDSADKEGKVVMVHEYTRDGSGLGNGSLASKAARLTGKGIKSAWDYVFKDQEDKAK